LGKIFSDFFYRRLGKKLRALRKNAGIRQSELAFKFGLNQSSISKFEKGELIPSLETLLQYAEYFKVGLDELLGLQHRERSFAFSEDKGEYIPVLRIKKVPVLKALPLSVNGITEDMIEGYISIPLNIYREKCFVVKYSGEGMSPLIKDGEMILVKPESLKDGKHVWVLNTQNTPIVGYVRIKGFSVTVKPENPIFQPIILPKSSISFSGRIMAIIRY